MGKSRSIKQKLRGMMYQNPRIDKQALTMKKSFDEVKEMLDNTGKKKNNTEEDTNMAKEFTDQNFEEEVLKSELPVLVDFYADWCGPCKMMAPVIENLAVEYAGRINVGKLNVDTSQASAVRYRVMSIPTMILFVNGEVKETVVGAVSAKELVQKLDKVLNG